VLQRAAVEIFQKLPQRFQRRRGSRRFPGRRDRNIGRDGGIRARRCDGWRQRRRAGRLLVYHGRARLGRELRISQPVDRLVAKRAIDPGLEVKGQQLLNGRGGLGGHGGRVRHPGQSRPACVDAKCISMVVLSPKIGNNGARLEAFLTGSKSGHETDHEQRRVTPARIHGIRRRDRRRRPVRTFAAIRLKQINPDLNVVVVEKGSEVGAHILSGAVIDPAGLDKLVPDWRQDPDCPLTTQVKDDRFFWFTETGAIKLPNFIMPPLMNNHHCYIGSLGNVCRWLAPKAEALGVEIYPGFAAAEVLYDEKGTVRGIATGDMGIAKDGSHKDSFTRGMELLGKYTLFAEGARGSLTKQLIAKFALDSKSEPRSSASA
jgi:hypothetical protein